MNRAALSSLGLLLLAAPACEREDLYGGSDFTENVASAFADCNPSEVAFLATKHNIQTAFENCGSNNFTSFAWSPNGVFLAFGLSNSLYMMNAEQKTIGSVPVQRVAGRATWLRDDVLAVPVGPPLQEGETSSAAPVADRFMVYHSAAQSLTPVTPTAREPQDLGAWGESDVILFTGVGEDGVRRPYKVDPSTGEQTRAFEWLDAPVTRLSWSPEAGLLAWSDAAGTTLTRADGSVLGTFPGITRGVVHHEGRYVALETSGAPISPFDQRAWDELSEEARDRELARQQEWLKRLPDHVPRTVTPPELQILDLLKGVRYRITAFYGDQFEWYHPRNYFCSFMLWGIEGKMLNRNVALADVFERLRMADKGEVPMGLEVMPSELSSPDAAPEAPAEGAAPATSP